MQDVNLRIKPRPSKLFMYEIFYSDLNDIKIKNNNLSITEFACGASKILKNIQPDFYQGIDLKEELILNSRKLNSNQNYNFFKGNMVNFSTNIKTNLGICIQTFGINLDFDEEIFIKCLNNLNNHVSKNGSLIFNISSDLYYKYQKNIDQFCEKNFNETKYIHYGIFNGRYNYRISRFLILLEHLLSFKSKIKKHLYIKCTNKIF